MSLENSRFDGSKWHFLVDRVNEAQRLSGMNSGLIQESGYGCGDETGVESQDGFDASIENSLQTKSNVAHLLCFERLS